MEGSQGGSEMNKIFQNEFGSTAVAMVKVVPLSSCSRLAYNIAWLQYCEAKSVLL